MPEKKKKLMPYQSISPASGQNMSRACLTGALVGAQVGLRGIPARFIDGLADGLEIIALAQKIAALPNCTSHANKEITQ